MKRNISIFKIETIVDLAIIGLQSYYTYTYYGELMTGLESNPEDESFFGSFEY